MSASALGSRIFSSAQLAPRTQTGHVGETSSTIRGFPASLLNWACNSSTFCRLCKPARSCGSAALSWPHPRSGNTRAGQRRNVVLILYPLLSRVPKYPVDRGAEDSAGEWPPATPTTISNTAAPFYALATHRAPIQKITAHPHIKEGFAHSAHAHA